MGSDEQRRRLFLGWFLCKDQTGIFTFNFGNHINLVKPARVVCVCAFDVAEHLGVGLLFSRKPLEYPSIFSDMAVASHEQDHSILNTVDNAGHPNISRNLTLDHGANGQDWQHIAVPFLDGFVLITKESRVDLIELVCVDGLWAENSRKTIGHDFSHIRIGQIRRDQRDFFIERQLHERFVKTPFPTC